MTFVEENYDITVMLLLIFLLERKASFGFLKAMQVDFYFSHYYDRAINVKRYEKHDSV